MLQGKSAKEAILDHGEGLQLKNDRDLRWANLSGTKIPRLKAEYVNLQGADLSWAHLQWANLSWAHLQGADLYEAHLQWADLSRAHLQGTILSDAHLQWASLPSAHLQGADLSRAYLQGADLSRAHLQGASLLRAYFQGATFFLADLSLSDFRNTDLRPLSAEEYDELKKWLPNDPRYLERLYQARQGELTLPEGKFPGLLADPGSPFAQLVEPLSEKERAKRRVQLACTDKFIALGIARQYSNKMEAQELLKADCPPLAQLPTDYRKRLEFIANRPD